uniref:RNA 2',3'-cyclic phosphodiesterase n=1 Tax=Thaumasiovibrio occultus TaxID=1891184 RepID=UPI000B35E4EB|nr:RNA 2',3'-cyclic phosphodiesterase [Thaumasiovibrio occultus]
MRLFYALTFDTATRKTLSEYRDVVLGQSTQGHFTPEENFHVTLAFLGSVIDDRADKLIELMADTVSIPDMVLIDRYDRFTQPEGDIAWLGVRPEPDLMALQTDVQSKLVEIGYRVEHRPFVPHITVGRQLAATDSSLLPFASPLALPVYSFALMESRQESNGHVYYTPRHEIYPLG